LLDDVYVVVACRCHAHAAGDARYAADMIARAAQHIFMLISPLPRPAAIFGARSLFRRARFCCVLPAPRCRHFTAPCYFMRAITRARPLDDAPMSLLLLDVIFAMTQMPRYFAGHYCLRDYADDYATLTLICRHTPSPRMLRLIFKHAC